MEIKQIYGLVNNATKEIVGESVLLQEDLQNVVDVGVAVFNANAVDAYVRSLINHIGKVIFVNRKYVGRVPSLLVDGWEFGSVLEKVRTILPEAQENESWELEDGTSYDPNVFYKPTVSVKFYNSKTTFEVPLSITEEQVKQSFSNREQLNAFISMLYNAVDNSMQIKTDAMIMRTINAMIGETLHAEVPSGTYTGRTSAKAVNLLYEYNQRFGTSLTASNAMTNGDFLKFASYIIGLTADNMKTMSRIYNIGGTDKFTADDRRHTVLLSQFAKAIGPYSLSGAFNESYLKLPEAETVSAWQGSGTSYAFADASKINIKTPSGDVVEASGIIGVMFDRDACMVANMNKRTTSNMNGKAEFTNYWFKQDCSYLVDMDENFVVFYVA